MKGGHTPIHIQRFAPADLWADEHWKVLVARRDYLTMSFYRAFMDHAFMAGGDLPAAPEALAAVLHMARRDVEKALGFCLGRLVFQDGERLYQGRVRREIAAELQYRREQSEAGKKGGRPKRGGGNEGGPKGGLSVNQSPPAPTPTPLPSTSAASGAASRAGGAEGNSRAGSNGGPPAPPASGAPCDLFDLDVLDHDPGNALEARLASRVAYLTGLVRKRDGEADARDTLAAVSATDKGDVLDHIRGAPDRWVEATLPACDKFEADLTGGDEPPDEGRG